MDNFKQFLVFLFYVVHLQGAESLSKTYTNPVLNDNRPDPAILKLDSNPGFEALDSRQDAVHGFVAVSTSDFAISNKDPALPLIWSKDLVHWEQKAYVFPADGWPKWAYTDIWAPEIHRINDNYYVYFSARKRSDNQLAIGVAISKNNSNPFGPYKDLGRPIIETSPGVIDIHYFKDPKDDVPYLVWKIDYNSIRLPSKIFIRRVHADGFTFKKSWPRYTMIRSIEPDDYLVVEGPSMMYQSGYYYLFFSGDGFQSENYHVSVARSSTVTGPYTRSESEYFLHTDLYRFGDGRNSTFTGPGGGTAFQACSGGGEDSWWYIYHAWRYNLTDVNPPGRVLNIDKIKWKDGWPFIGTPTDTPQPVPVV